MTKPVHRSVISSPVYKDAQRALNEECRRQVEAIARTYTSEEICLKPTSPQMNVGERIRKKVESVITSLDREAQAIEGGDDGGETKQ